MLTIQKSIGLVDQQYDALKLALEDLKICTLDPAIHQPENQGEPPRNLMSFVDEDGIENLQNSVKSTIDDAQLCHQEMQTLLSNFDSALSSFRKESSHEKEYSTQEELEKAHNETSIIARDAHEMAMLLESLARHYDQCTQAYQLSVEVMNGKSSTDVSEELEELTTVLSSDAVEIDGVVVELYERRSNIATSSKVVVDFLASVEQKHGKAVQHFELLEKFGKTELVEVDTKIKDLVKAHDEHLNEIMEGLLPEIASLANYYRLFLRSYNAMILEIARRKAYQSKLKTLQEEMQRKISTVVDGRYKTPLARCHILTHLQMK